MKPINPAQKTRYNIEALSRGLEILSLFTSEQSALSFSQIVDLLGLNKSTVFRMLATLEAHHFIEQDRQTRLYRPGIRVLQLGFTAINSMEISQVAHPHLEELSLRLGETVSLAVLDDFRTIYVDRIRNQALVGVVVKIGSSLPAHCSSLGKVLLAGLSFPALDQLLNANPLTPYTQKTTTSRDVLLQELDAIRKQQYAVGDEELAVGLRAVSAPIREASGTTVAAVNVSGLTQQMSYQRIQDEVTPVLMETVQKISTFLGFKTNGYQK